MSEQGEVMELWATKGTWTLHATEGCCRGRGHRRQVKDHANPAYFDLDRFVLCPSAKKLLENVRA